MSSEPFLEDAEDLYQNAPFGYLTMRADGVIVNMNATLLAWLGLEPGAIVLQRSFQDLLGMGEKIYFETHIMPLLQMQGEVSEINLELKGKEAIALPVLINARRVPGMPGSQPLYRFSVLDISQRKQYELELMKARRAAEETTRRLKEINQELEQFANIASHDLQAPLRTITSLIDLMEKKGLLPSGGATGDYFTLIKSNAQQMRLMVSALLDHSRIGGKEIDLREVSLNQVCASALKLLADDVKESNAVFKIPELPMVVGDKTQLIRLFLNLFSNSIKYRSEATPVISVEFEEKGDELTVFVKDNGIGFDPQHAERIFGFMQRLHTYAHIPGTGIGLAACKRIVEIHGGVIGARSEAGKGSTFYFTLPLKERSTVG